MAFRCAFRPFGLLPVAVLLLASLALLVPWKTCGTCDGQGPAWKAAYAEWGEIPADATGWSCPACRDRGRGSPLTFLLAPKPGPVLARLAEARRPGPASSDYPARLYALLDYAGADRTLVTGYPIHHTCFLPTDVGDLFVLMLSGSQGNFGPRHPMPWGARLVLFDLDGALLDHVTLEDDDQLANLEVLRSPTLSNDVPLIHAWSKLAGDASTANLELRVRRDRSAQKLPPEDLGTVRGDRVRVAVKGGRFVPAPPP